jgi:hypothetical protein
MFAELVLITELLFNDTKVATNGSTPPATTPITIKEYTLLLAGKGR